MVIIQLCLWADKHLSCLISRTNRFFNGYSKATATFETTKTHTRVYSSNLIILFTHNNNFSVFHFSVLLLHTCGTWGTLAQNATPLLNLEIPIFRDSQWRSHFPSLLPILSPECTEEQEIGPASPMVFSWASSALTPNNAESEGLDWPYWNKAYTGYFAHLVLLLYVTIALLLVSIPRKSTALVELPSF